MMTRAELDGMSLADIEAVAARLDAALRTIQTAMQLLQGGSAVPPAPIDKVGTSASWRPQVSEAPLPHIAQAKAAREEFLRNARASPERQAKLEQFKHDTPEETADDDGTP